MIWGLGIAVLLALAIYSIGLWRTGNLASLLAILRVVIGGGSLLVAAILGLGGRVGPASILAAIGASVLFRGRLGPIDFNTTQTPKGQASSVKSRFIAMHLDHENGDMAGQVIAGGLKGSDLADLDEDKSRQLYAEISNDPDSLALFETWFDKYRDGWRDYFGGPAGQQNDGAANSGSAIDTLAEAYAILGLQPGASEEEIQAAHRRMMKSVHPDQGGSTYLATKVNEAKDMLLAATKS